MTSAAPSPVVAPPDRAGCSLRRALPTLGARPVKRRRLHPESPSFVISPRELASLRTQSQRRFHGKRDVSGSLQLAKTLPSHPSIALDAPTHQALTSTHPAHAELAPDPLCKSSGRTYAQLPSSHSSQAAMLEPDCSRLWSTGVELKGRQLLASSPPMIRSIALLHPSNVSDKGHQMENVKFEMVQESPQQVNLECKATLRGVLPAVITCDFSPDVVTHVKNAPPQLKYEFPIDNIVFELEWIARTSFLVWPEQADSAVVRPRGGSQEPLSVSECLSLLLQKVMAAAFKHWKDSGAFRPYLAFAKAHSRERVATMDVEAVKMILEIVSRNSGRVAGPNNGWTRAGTLPVCIKRSNKPVVSQAADGSRVEETTTSAIVAHMEGDLPGWFIRRRERVLLGPPNLVSGQSAPPSYPTTRVSRQAYRLGLVNMQQVEEALYKQFKAKEVLFHRVTDRRVIIWAKDLPKALDRGIDEFLRRVRSPRPLRFRVFGRAEYHHPNSAASATSSLAQSSSVEATAPIPDANSEPSG